MMKFGVLGTGVAGTTIASKLVSLGNEVMIDSRSEANEKAIDWAIKNANKAYNGTFEQAASLGEIVLLWVKDWLHFQTPYFAMKFLNNKD